MHPIRYASWSRDAEDKPSRPQAWANPQAEADESTWRWLNQASARSKNTRQVDVT
jgi:hypothetical protein